MKVTTRRPYHFHSYTRPLVLQGARFKANWHNWAMRYIFEGRRLRRRDPGRRDL